MAFAVGIDLGTTNTVVASVRQGVAGTIPDPDGVRLLPSVVSFHPSGSTVVGRAALDRRMVDGANTIYSVKRLIGLPWGSTEVQTARAELPFELQEGAHGGAVVAARGERYTLPEISAFVLRHAKAVAEAALGPPVERAVVTVPANFNDLQRAATKTACRLAGLEVLRILNEPTAAALAYGPPEKARERVAVYDLGGGTFDVTLLDLAGNVLEVLSTAGDTALGGDDVDLLVAERMAEDLLKKHRFDARAQPAAFGQLRLLAERMKCDLSSRDEQTLSIDDLVPGERGATTPWRFRMTRPELEWAALALVERTFKVCRQALDTAGVRAADIDRVILVGGATRMPMVARKVEQFFGRPPTVRINPDEVVALGAAIQAALLDRSRRKNAEPAVHPRIAQESVVQPLPVASSRESDPALPLVGPVPSAQPPPAVVHERRPDAISLAPSPPSLPVLPRQATKQLVFDVPDLVIEPLPPSHAGTPPRPAPPAPGSAKTAGPPLPPKRPRAPTIPFPFEAASSPAVPEPPAPPPPAPAPSPPRPAPLLIDVTPLGLCVETVGDYCDVLIDANTPVPCDRTRSFTTASDNQTAVQVRVAQGKSGRFTENTFLGELELSGIAPAPRGEMQVAVTFEIDADGILNVRARDIKTGRQTAARLQLVGANTSPAEIAAMQARQAAHPLAPLERR
ncbi:MAG TPA: Hsp70 family protein [Polyangiaceae bacterium]|jgi:molecular chaperone DnaK